MNRSKAQRPIWSVVLTICFAGIPVGGRAQETVPLRVGTFSCDITIPLGHRCMGVLKTKANRIEDPLDAHGIVLLSDGKPVVLVALDWCEVRNGAYDQWRRKLAVAAKTTVDRILVCALHQHDAPVTDSGAEAYLDKVGLSGELYDVAFHERCVREVAAAVELAITNAQTLTHLGIGQARVEKIASNRRVVHEDGSIRYDRYSSMRGDTFQAKAPEGQIDPMLKSVTFFNDSHPIAVIHSYATHPMSYYGKGGVSADFVGIARRRRQLETPGTKQIYVSGCSGDVTAGKYNSGSPEMRAVLADRLYEAMKRAEENTSRTPLGSIDFRSEAFQLPYHEGEKFQRKSLQRALRDADAPVEERISAAMGLSSLDRVERGQPIDLPCLELGPARIVLLPGEAFVGYQLMAQSLRPDQFVMAIGYGECWPGYIPTTQAFEEGFGHGWRWVGPGCEPIIRAALDRVLGPPDDG